MIESLTGQGINVRHACRVLGVSESGYYAWKDRPPSPRTLRRIWLAREITDIHKASGGTYGALRVTAELRRGRHVIVGHNTIESIMQQLGIKGLPTRRLPKGARVQSVTSLDLVRREFRRRAPNELWMTDITEHPPARVRSTAASSWMPSRAWLSAGPSIAPKRPCSSPTRSGWQPAAAALETAS